MDEDLKWRLVWILQTLSEKLRVLPWCLPFATTKFCCNDELWGATHVLERLHPPIWTQTYEVKSLDSHFTPSCFLKECYTPPENSVVNWPACRSQQTFPEWKVWLLALIETDFTVIPVAAKSNFQLILPIAESSVRAMYTWREKYINGSWLENHVTPGYFNNGT